MKKCLVLTAITLLSVATTFAGYRPAQALKAIPADASTYGFFANSKTTSPFFTNLKKELKSGASLADKITESEPRFKAFLKEAGIDTSKKDLLEYIDLVTFGTSAGEKDGLDASYYISGSFNGPKLLKSLYTVVADASKQATGKPLSLTYKNDTISGTADIVMPGSGKKEGITILAKAGTDYITVKTGAFAKDFAPMGSNLVLAKLPAKQGFPTCYSYSKITAKVDPNDPMAAMNPMANAKDITIVIAENAKGALAIAAKATFTSADAANQVNMQLSGMQMMFQSNFAQQAATDPQAKLFADLLGSISIRYKPGSDSLTISIPFTVKTFAAFLASDRVSVNAPTL